jgi:multidrug transporter EmrE-like cation transporter
MYKKSNLIKTRIYIYLLLINLFYSSISILTKQTSLKLFFSFSFFIGFASILLLFFIYAVVWQQLLKRIQLSIAYMFKGSSIIFILIISNLFFNEKISIANVIGCLLVCIGIIIMFFDKPNS